MDMINPSRDVLRGVTAPIDDDIARLLNMSRTGVYAAAKRGDLPAVRIGNRVLILCGPLRRILQLEAEAA